MERFFDVGEWLKCFEGSWIVVLNDPDHPIARHPACLAFRSHFGDELADWGKP